MIIHSIWIWQGQVDFDDSWKARLQHLIDQSAKFMLRRMSILDIGLGRELRAFIEAHQLKPDFVAVHGQTIFTNRIKTSLAKLAMERP